MKTKIILFFVLFCLTTTSFAQHNHSGNYHAGNYSTGYYNTGIGLRGGLYNGLTVKHFLSSNTAFEGLITSRWQGIELTGLYEVQNNFPGMKRLSSYIGFGGHVGFWNGDHTAWGTTGTEYTTIGIDGIIGLEYCFMFLPINLSLDWKPEFNFIGYTGFWYDGGALSIRYIF